MTKQIDEQLIDLQTRFAFQEDSLQALNDVVARQQLQINQLEEALAVSRHRVEELLDVMSSLSPGGAAAHEPPPHY